MLPHWQKVTTVLVTLAMKIGALDKDGLDLKYTIGTSYNVSEVSGWSIPKALESSMQQAGCEIEPRYKSSMSETLRKIFDGYKNINKKMTLIILTDGLWKGETNDDNVEKLIATFILDLDKRLKKWESRWFSIQFVYFGNDENAIRRLDKLDNNMPIE